jgi:hypothetical protein
MLLHRAAYASAAPALNLREGEGTTSLVAQSRSYVGFEAARAILRQRPAHLVEHGIEHGVDPGQRRIIGRDGQMAGR